MEILSVGTELFHTYGRTDGQTDMKKLNIALRNFANATKNDSWKSKSKLSTYLLISTYSTELSHS